MISRVSGRAHITPVLKQLYWLPVRQGITHKLLTLAFKAINCTDFPSYLGLQWSQLTRQLRSSGRQLVVPRTRDRAYDVVAPRLWNGLPDSVKLLQTLNTFKRHSHQNSFIQRAFRGYMNTIQSSLQTAQNF